MFYDRDLTLGMNRVQYKTNSVRNTHNPYCTLISLCMCILNLEGNQMRFYLNIFRYDMINRPQLFYNSSFRTSVAWTKLNLPLSVNIYNFSGLLVWQIMHSCQSKEALPLFALVGASFKGLQNCDIFRKFYTTDSELVTTNVWTQCKQC